MKLRSWIGLLCAPALFAALALAQEGSALFNTYCAICHDGGTNSQAPSREVLGRMAPEQILQTLEKGAMKTQAAERSRAQLRTLAEYLSGKPLGNAAAIIPATASCGARTTSAASLAAPVWNGWGAGLANARFQSREAAAMTAADVPRLKLKWAF